MFSCVFYLVESKKLSKSYFKGCTKSPSFIWRRVYVFHIIWSLRKRLPVCFLNCIMYLLMKAKVGL